MYSLLIQNGMVLDGTGAPAVRADVAVEGGRIAAVGQLQEAKAHRVIDASGKLVTPGFIDIHRHADAALFRPGFGSLELRQGLTTIVSGNCGLSLAPLGGAHLEEILSYLRPITGDAREGAAPAMADYLRRASETSLPLNVGMLAGSGTIRAAVAGYAQKGLTEEQYRAIWRTLEESLAQGALGVSLGLGYAPECFYTTEELIRALSPLRGQDIPLTVHMREEGGGVCEALEEMLTVARALKVPLHVSHLKAMGKENWGVKIPRALELMQRAREEGLDVSCDVYPYTAGSTQLLHILPPDFLVGGMEAVTQRLTDKTQRETLRRRIAEGADFDNIARLAGWDGIYLTSLARPESRIYQGKSLREIGEMQGKDPFDSCCDLLVSESCRVTMIDFMASEEDIVRILRDKYSSVISDATYPTEGQPHPRVYGTFVRLLEHFVTGTGALTAAQAVHKMTLSPAKALRLKGKGVLTPGADADINVFALKELHEAGTYTDPCREAEGMDTVIVGGGVALEKGALTSGFGRVVRR